MLASHYFHTWLHALRTSYADIFKRSAGSAAVYLFSAATPDIINIPSDIAMIASAAYIRRDGR